MSNKNDVVIIELDRPRQLWCGHKALKTLTSLLGKNMDELDPSNFSMEEVEKVMYCLMLHDAKEQGETLTLAQMEDLLDMVPFGEVASKMTAAFEAAFGSEDSDPKNVQGIADQSGTGTPA